jgi:hypothetical protein
MRALFLAFFLLGSASAMANRLIVHADIAYLPEAGYARVPRDPDCDKPTASGDLVTICLWGWSRYRLTGVTRLDGAHVDDTVALIYSDPILAGRWRLTLQRLDASAAAKYGAEYKAVTASPSKEMKAP